MNLLHLNSLWKDEKMGLFLSVLWVFLYILIDFILVGELLRIRHFLCNIMYLNYTLGVEITFKVHITFSYWSVYKYNVSVIFRKFYQENTLYDTWKLKYCPPEGSHFSSILLFKKKKSHILIIIAYTPVSKSSKYPKCLQKIPKQ